MSEVWGTFHSDQFYSPEKVRRALGENPYDYVDRWVSYADKKASHGKISHPDAGLVSQVIPIGITAETKDNVDPEGDNWENIIGTLLAA